MAGAESEGHNYLILTVKNPSLIKWVFSYNWPNIVRIIIPLVISFPKTLTCYRQGNRMESALFFH